MRHMTLFCTPCVSHLREDFILRTHRILAGQMDLWLVHIPDTARLNG